MSGAAVRPTSPEIKRAFRVTPGSSVPAGWCPTSGADLASDLLSDRSEGDTDMGSTHILRTSLAATAVAVGLFTTTPAQAGWGVRVGFGATVVLPPLVLSVGNAAPAVPYFRPYAAGCNVNRYDTPAYAPRYTPNCAPYYAPAYAPGYAPYYPGYATATPVVVAPPVSYLRVWVPGPRPHWEMRRAARFDHRRR